jgi:hypothetical protein
MAEQSKSNVSVSVSSSNSRFGPFWWTVAAFGTYFCMYGFRKPFTAASYANMTVWGMDYKTVIVTAQVLGYMTSKFIGIKMVAEISHERRIARIVVLIAVAEFALILFGLVASPWNFVFLFLNGLPLGMVFGLVVGVLEGRRQTELLTAGLCASFILADGVTKSVGSWLLQLGLPEFWMPAAAGLVFSVPLLIFVAMLANVPPPNPEDVLARSERLPLDSIARKQFFRRHASGLVFLVSAYTLVTILRSIRADFAAEIWSGLGLTIVPEIFTRSEMLVAATVFLINGLTAFIQDNRRAFHVAMSISMLGLVLLLAAPFCLQAGLCDGFTFMVLVGLGLYLPYVAVQTTIFERLIALTRDRGNLGYLVSLADAFGYLGYVAVMLGKNAVPIGSGFLVFFVWTSVSIGVLAIIALGLAWRDFLSRSSKNSAT